jgi:hypothetical protein
MIARITRAYVRHYSDNGQTTAYVEWRDQQGRVGRTEGRVCSRKGDAANMPAGSLMTALFARAVRDGVPIEHKTW